MSDQTTPSLRCVEFVDYITDWEEGALSDDIRAEVEEHLAFCTPCIAYVHQLRATVTSLRGALDEAPPASARETALAVFRERLEQRDEN
jgi:anti-sigma factor RsiW